MSEKIIELVLKYVEVGQDIELSLAGSTEQVQGRVLELTEQGMVLETLSYRRRDKFLACGSQPLSSRNSSGPEAAVKNRISELERIIAKQTVQI
jgi:hypothetical protein